MKVTIPLIILFALSTIVSVWFNIAQSTQISVLEQNLIACESRTSQIQNYEFQKCNVQIKAIKQSCERRTRIVSKELSICRDAKLLAGELKDDPNALLEAYRGYLGYSSPSLPSPDSPVPP